MIRSLVFTTVLLFSSNAFAEIVIKMPVAGTGNYDLVSNGDFDSGIGGWSRIQSEPYGHMTWDSSNGFNGLGAITANPTVPRPGPGFAYQRPVTGLIAGETYVLSGAFNADTLGDGSLYLDMTDAIGGDTGIRPSVLGEVPTGWFFTFNEFTATGTTAHVRIIRDTYGSDLQAGGFVDEISVTPVSSFVAPVSAVPEPSATVAMMLAGGAVLFSRHRKRKVRRDSPVIERPSRWRC